MIITQYNHKSRNSITLAESIIFRSSWMIFDKLARINILPIFEMHPNFIRIMKETKNYIFIHGNSLNKNTFSKQNNFFENAHFLDLPGHGDADRSKTPEEDYNLIAYSKKVVNYINENKLSNVVLIGHSLGGHIAIHAVKNCEQIIGLFVFGTPPLTFPPRLEQAFQANENVGLFFRPDLSSDQVQNLCELIGISNENAVQAILKTDPNCRLHLFQSIARGMMWDESEILQNLKIPCLLLHAKRDKVVNGDYISEIIQTCSKNVRLEFIDSEHSPQLSESEKFNEILEQFVSGIKVPTQNH